jgi:hypothetical protein
MPDTAEHRAEMHRLATRRRSAGKPVWNSKIHLGDIFRNEDMTFKERRDAITARLRASTWLKSHGEYDTIRYLVDELADAENTDEFDEVWDVIYDEADADRVWIETR